MDARALQREIEQLRRANAELAFLTDLARSTSVSVDFDELIRTVVGKSVRAVDAEQGAIILIEEDTGEGRTLVRSIVTSGSHIALGVDQLLVGWMGVHKAPLNLSDPSKDPRFKGADWDKSVRSLACVPLLVQSDLIGTLVVFNKKPADAFSEDDIRLLTIIAGQSAQVVENARLYGVEQLHEMLKLTQAQLIQSKKMASLGSLVAGLLHELNSPLGAIQSSGDVTAKCVSKIVELVDSGRDAQEVTVQLKKYAETLVQINDVVQKAGQKVARVFDSLKSFAGTDQAELQNIDLNRHIENTLALMEHEFSDRIEVTCRLGDIPPVQCHSADIAQVIMHLLNNAVQSIDTQGSITVRTRLAGDHVCIEVTDTGRGMTERHMRRLYEPTFNKTGATVRAGLGLFICSNIVHRHRGEIEADSKPDHGTTMTVTLPISQTPA